MTPQEKELIMGFAARLRDAPVPQKDPEAEALIQREIVSRPDAAYLMTQAVLVQEHALKQAQAQIQSLQNEVEQARQREAQAPAAQQGGFLSGLLGGQRPAVPPSPHVGGYPPPGAAQAAPGGGGGGFGDFMKSAASVAVGVAGGHLLFSGLSSLFGDESEPGVAEAAEEPGGSEPAAAAAPTADSAQPAQGWGEDETPAASGDESLPSDYDAAGGWGGDGGGDGGEDPDGFDEEAF